jgi:Zn-dependent M16 (insulinase) family peptidase
MVNLFATLATEAVTKPGIYHGDDGLPHTLEHLVFLGSAQYPYKGVLDKLANRCLAQGTNAWTATDHTAYTVTCAGDEAFLNLLPVYLDHILHPTLTAEGFVTEVHHVTAEGADKGVVYCEMQGRENGDADLCERALMGALFPGTGLASETGGLLANLRGLDNGKVCAHSEHGGRDET